MANTRGKHSQPLGNSSEPMPIGGTDARGDMPRPVAAGGNFTNRAGINVPDVQPMSPDATQTASFDAVGYGQPAAQADVDFGAGSKYSRSAGQYSANQKYYNQGVIPLTTKKSRKGRNIALGVVAILLVVFAGVGVASALYFNSLNDSLSGENKEEAAEVKEVLAPTVSDEPFYMMLLGSDGRGEVEGERSDTNIVARVDLKTNTVTLLSIPRDTAINYGTYGTQKFNAAYAFDGASGAIKAADDLLGIKISHYAEIRFEGVIELVDALGGVEVDVPMAINDVDAGGQVDQGLQTLDGEHALIFARSRSYATGDYQRSTSQRILIEAIANKVMSLPPTELPNVVQKLCACVTTDMNVTDIIGYAQAFRSGPGLTMYSALIPCTDTMVDGVSYVVCNTEQLKKMMTAVDSGLDPTPYATDGTVSSSEEAIREGQEGVPQLVPGDSETAGTDSYYYYEEPTYYEESTYYEEPTYYYDEDYSSSSGSSSSYDEDEDV